MKDCMHTEGFRVEPGAFSKESLRAWSETKLVCPLCRGAVRYRHGNHVTPHFSHHANTHCDYWEPETVEHMAGKQMLKSWLEKVFPSNVTTTEYYVTEIRQRPDIMTVFPDGHRLCVEYQCSPISDEVLKKRIEGYDQAGISQLWVIGGSLFKGRAINRFRLHTWENRIQNRQENGLYLLDPKLNQPLVHISHVRASGGKKTSFSCRGRKEWCLSDLGISRFGKILFPGEVQQGMGVYSNKSSQAIHRNQVIPNGSKMNRILKRERERDFEKNPLRSFALSRIGEYLSHPVFNQFLEGDDLFLLDHRLWQSYLFLTEIHKIFQRRAVYSTGTKVPTIFIKYILIKDSRFPERPFQIVLDKYVNKVLYHALQFKKSETTIKTIYELVYEYFCRLEMLGFLKNVTPNRENIAPTGKLYGRFEVLFDQFCPELFGDTEQEVKAFFRNHSLRYVKNQWYDFRNNPAAPLKISRMGKGTDGG